MTEFRIAMNRLFRWYQFDSEKMAKLMEIDRITSYKDALDMIGIMQQEIADVRTALEKEKEKNELHSLPIPDPKPKTESKPKVERKRIYYCPVDIKNMSQKNLREYKRVAKARNELRNRGYEIERGKKIAYYRPFTDRSLEQKYSKVYGFTFEKSKEK